MGNSETDQTVISRLDRGVRFKPIKRKKFTDELKQLAIDYIGKFNGNVKELCAALDMNRRNLYRNLRTDEEFAAKFNSEREVSHAAIRDNIESISLEQVEINPAKVQALTILHLKAHNPAQYRNNYNQLNISAKNVPFDMSGMPNFYNKEMQEKFKAEEAEYKEIKSNESNKHAEKRN